MDDFSSRLFEVLGLTAAAVAAVLFFVYLVYRMKGRRERKAEELLEKEEERKSHGFARSVIERELEHMDRSLPEPA